MWSFWSFQALPGNIRVCVCVFSLYTSSYGIIPLVCVAKGDSCLHSCCVTSLVLFILPSFKSWIPRVLTITPPPHSWIYLESRGAVSWEAHFTGTQGWLEKLPESLTGPGSGHRYFLTVTNTLTNQCVLLAFPESQQRDVHTEWCWRWRLSGVADCTHNMAGIRMIQTCLPLIYCILIYKYASHYNHLLRMVAHGRRVLLVSCWCI